MAKAAGFAPSTIHRIWKAFNLQPRRTETFKLSTDPLFVEKARDIVATEMACSLHPDRQLLGESGRALLRRHNRKQIRRGVHRSAEELGKAIRSHIEAVNDDPKPFRWTKSADNILVRGRDVHFWTPPAQIRTSPIRASSSYLGCVTAKRRSGAFRTRSSAWVTRARP